MGPANGIVGDGNFGIDLPEVEKTDELAELRRVAKFAKSKEWKELKKHLESRIEFYQQYLPDGRNPLALSPESKIALGNDWLIANGIIGEFKTLINLHEQAVEMLKDAATE